MNEEEIIKLLQEGFNSNRSKEYRELYKATFNETPNSCSCSNGAVYNRLRNKYLSNEAAKG